MSEINSEIDNLLNTVSRLRKECPWDNKQTHETLVRHLIEEAYEVVDVISSLDRKDSYKELKSELGDLLFQILLHAKIAEEKDQFSIEDIFQSLDDKLIERHPHVFKDESFNSAEEVEKAWELRKQESRGKKSIFDDLEERLSSLEFAAKAQRKAKSIGLTYENLEDSVKDFLSEVEEFKSSDSLEEKREEFGDMLFSLVNISRYLETDSELELRKAVKRFVYRAKYVESEIDSSEKDLNELWSAAKKKEKSLKEE
ncbi:MAG: nucleoside triphosphate pyrophosphohydrolase [Candidatus Actinomarinales bacterium]|nr:MAG: nucleoside triphosphate pyrophosphohydrolase [Candidatus Actinomarinales bacterium]